MNPGTVPGTFWNTNVENHEPSEHRYQDDPHPGVGPSVYPSRHSNDSDPGEAPHMVTGVQEENRYRHHMVTGVQEKIPYCSPGTFSAEKEGALYNSTTSSQ